MATYAADTIGRTLSRLATFGARSPRGAEQPLDTRTIIQRFVEDSPEPVTIEDICRTTELHHNTVRGHIEVLCAAGDLVRVRGPRKGRGRPPWLYRSANADPTPYEQLAASLQEQLAAASDPQQTQDAARRWWAASTTVRAADSPEHAVDVAVDALNDLGFQAQATPAGTEISLAACPYADLIADHPAICDIHTAAVQQILEDTGQPVQLTSMDVWARPGLCVAHLARPDVEPARRITPKKSAASTTRKKKA